MDQKELFEQFNEFTEQKKRRELLEEENFRECLKFVENHSLIESKEFNVLEMLRYEKLIFDFLSEKYRDITISGYTVLTNLSKAGNDLNNNSAIDIFPSKLTCECGKYFLKKKDASSNDKKGKEISDYLSNMDFSEINIRIFENDKSYVIRFMDILILSMFYIYDSGRVYKKHFKSDGSAYYKTEKIYDNKMDCFSLVFNKTLDLFDKKFYDESNFEDRLYASAQLNKIDNLFKFFKVCRMAKGMEEIITSEMQLKKSELYLHLGCLNYKDIISAYEKNVFYDKEFVDFCLNTECPDPFSYFKATIHRYSNGLYKDIMNNRTTISEFISECKKETMEVIKYRLQSISYSLMEDVFEPINDIRECKFKPKNECEEKMKNSFEVLIKKLCDTKFKDIDQFFKESDSIRSLTNKYEQIKKFREYFEMLDFVPDKTNFLCLLRNSSYNQKDAKSYFELHETAELFVNKMIDVTEKNFGFWEDYYFNSRNILKSYFESQPVVNRDYIDYLFEKVIENLNAKCVSMGEQKG